MADISKVTLLNGSSYDLKDASAVHDSSYVHTDSNFTAAEKTKLSGIATGAEVNVQVDWNVTDTASDAYIKNKPTSMPPTSHNHDDRYYTESEIDTKLSNKLDTSLKGVASGLAELGSDGKVPSSQLPSYVDDVLEYNDRASFPTTGETGKIYIAKDTNLTYRWSGSTYVEISPSLALGETSSTAYRGDRGKTAYDHSQSTHAPTDSKTAASGGTALSLVTTGEKYTWNDKGTYSKPSTGIPKTDLASEVQTSLGKADTALQSETYKGTVTSVAAGTGLTGGTITETGTIAHSTASGYKHIPSGGSSGKVLGWKADGEAQWVEQSSAGMQLVPGAVQNNIATYGTGGQVKDSSVPISGLLIADDAASAADPNPINANTLQGHAASYFLTADNVIDSLTSTSTDQALSANQGRILNENVQDIITDVDDLGEAVDTLSTTVSGKANIASPSFTGTPTVAANTSYTTAMMRNVILSTSAPTSSMGSNGDICIVYTA